MTGVIDAVMAAYLFVLPLLLAGLGITSLGRDRLSAGVLLVVAAAFGVCNTWEVLAMNLFVIPPLSPVVFFWLWPAAALGLWLRLFRDRRLRHQRNTPESLAVLGCGAILLAVLLSLPSILAQLASPPAA